MARLDFVRTLAAMLKVGQKAPDFAAEATDGRTLRLSELRGRPVVLYFFPRAFTLGCTMETKRFRDAHGDLEALGAEVVGISTDELEKQCKFAETHGAKFPLIGDADHAISEAYGAYSSLFSHDRRVT